jgi:beta-mannanase
VAFLVAALLALAALPSSAAAPEPVAKDARHRGQLGVMTLSFAQNTFVPWTPSDLREVRSFERRARQHADIVMWFCDWERCRFRASQAAAVRRRGSIPEITWEPWDARIPVRSPQPKYRLRRIIAGAHDRKIRRFARGVARYGHRVRIRLAHEMNGGAYPWAEQLNNNRRGEYRRMWRRVWRIFRRQGARNVTWIWAPVSAKILPGQYPGGRYVDVAGVSGFNGVFRDQFRPFRAIFGPRFAALRRIARGKPQSVPEVGSTENGGNKARWLTGMFKYLRSHRRVRSLVWFDIRKESDWRINSSRASRRAFARGAARWRGH